MGVSSLLFKESKQESKKETPTPPQPTGRELRYAQRALTNASDELRQCPKGRRNHLLNAMAYKTGRLIAKRWLHRETVERNLMRACEVNGLVGDDGEERCWKTLASGINAGMQRPYRDI
jgi:hypothetical protein